MSNKNDFKKEREIKINFENNRKYFYYKYKEEGENKKFKIYNIKSIAEKIYLLIKFLIKR